MGYVARGTAAALFLFATPALAVGPVVGDADFVRKAAAGNAFEVEEAKLAVERATDPRLKDFAQTMIADHTDAQKKLEEAGQKAGHKAGMSLDPVHQAMLDNLKTFTGTDFDKIYIADQIQAHVETVALLSDYKVDGKTKALKNWADDALPTVKHHLEAIDAM